MASKDQPAGTQIRNDAMQPKTQIDLHAPHGIPVRVNQRVRGDTTKKTRVPAGPCPASDTHKNTVVYSTKGRVRNCKCDDCGATWKVTGEFFEPWRECMMQLAETFAQLPRVDAQSGKVVVISAEDMDAFSKELTRFAEAG